MDVDLSNAAMWFRVIVWTIAAVLTFYNAHRYRGLMLVWFINNGVLFMFLSVSAFLRVTESPYYLVLNNLAFTPIAVSIVVFAFLFVINHKIPPPFNRRKEDV